MLRIKVGTKIVDIPRDVEAEGPKAVEEYVAEKAPAKKTAAKVAAKATKASEVKDAAEPAEPVTETNDSPEGGE